MPALRSIARSVVRAAFTVAVVIQASVGGNSSQPANSSAPANQG